MGAMNPRHFRAMAFAIDVGRRIGTDHPEIADDFRNGLSARQIAIKRGFFFEYATRTVRLASIAVGYALRGHDGTLSRPNYAGLIPPSERESLSREHRVKNGKYAAERLTFEQRSAGGVKGGQRSGREAALRKLGAHALSHEEKRAIGLRNLENGVGIHAMTHDERSEAGKRGNVAKAIAMGLPVWTEFEEHLAYHLADLEVFRRGPHIKREALAGALNDRFHHGRKARKGSSVYKALERQYKRHKEPFRLETPCSEIRAALERAKATVS